jgi:hypothetical protein
VYSITSSGTNIYFVGDASNIGVLGYSTDGGATLTNLPNASTSFPNPGVIFGVATNGSRLVVSGKTGVSSVGVLIYSDDGGTSWTPATVPGGLTSINRVI